MLCGLYYSGGRIQGTYTAKGITVLCEGLKGSAVTSLECAAAPIPRFLSAPVDTPALSPSPSHPLLGSLYGNRIGDGGASALAAVLKETKITFLKCAAIPKAFAFLSTPVDMSLS